MGFNVFNFFLFLEESFYHILHYSSQKSEPFFFLSPSFVPHSGLLIFDHYVVGRRRQCLCLHKHYSFSSFSLFAPRLCVRSLFFTAMDAKVSRRVIKSNLFTTERTEGAEKNSSSNIQLYFFFSSAAMRGVFFLPQRKRRFRNGRKGRFPFPALTPSFGKLTLIQHLYVPSNSDFDLPPSSFKK